jgi:hypothetical protein
MRDDWLNAPEMQAKIAEACAKLPPPCEHEFGGWRDFEDRNGGEQFCQKCGLGALAHSMWSDW